VGLATAVGLAEPGRDVGLVERDPDRLAALVEDRIPFHEPGLPEAYATQHAVGRIVPAAELPENRLDLVIVCVGTPIDDAGYADVSQVAYSIDQAIPAIAAGAACIIRSTLPVGSAARLARRPGVTPERLVVAPEFLRQGSALEDIRQPTEAELRALGYAVERIGDGVGGGWASDAAG
jgi:UDPglucose 6-dehydrogenase